MPVANETIVSVCCFAYAVQVRDGPVIAVVYVPPPPTPKRNIEAYMVDVFGWVLLGDDTPVVLTGGFNVETVRQEGKRFLLFMLERFGLVCVIGPAVPTTRHRTCIDLVFAKNVPAVGVQPMVVYPSDHKAMAVVVTK